MGELSATTRWLTGDDGAPALDKLEALVRGLTRARSAQIAVAVVLDGLFFGLVAASVGVVAVRLAGLEDHAAVLAAVSVSLAVAASALLAWRRRPDDLETAILADLRLNLQQKLSTAWELARAGNDPGLAEQLAARVVGPRSRLRAEGVFPLRPGGFGRLSPIAAGALILVAIVDVGRTQAPAPILADEAVVGEGVRLREFARRMEARALRDALPRSLAESRRMQRLGSRMETGTLARGEALSRLRLLGASLGEQRRALEARDGARGQAPRSDAAGDGRGTASRLASLGAEQILEALRDGLLEASDLRRLLGAEGGPDPALIERALRRFAAGESGELRSLLEELDADGAASREREELRQAEARIERSRRNLGDGEGDARDRADDAPAGLPSEEDGFEGFGGADAGEGDAGADGGDRRAGTFGREGTGTGEPAALPGASGLPGPVVRPQSLPGTGAVLRADARVLPRAGAPTVEAGEVEARFAPQLEEVLARDDYPAHYKAFIRRYFLNLSEGARAPAAAADR